MSKKKVQSYCLVVDASIAQAAGTLESQHPTGACCRDFLIAVRSVCHRMAWSEAIKTEWDKHESVFAGQWRVTMTNLKKLRPVKQEQLQELRSEIEESKDQKVAAIMRKDVHLVEAALATDMRLASLDDTVRGHFRQLAATVDSLRHVVWVNPAIEEEQAVKWLEAGARAERSRKLKA